MSFQLIRAVAKAEAADEFHIARLLLLLNASARGRGVPVQGITKLAKLDFLLRYPGILERALHAAGKDPQAAAVTADERTTIEAKMVRFRYGPWDARYRRWIGVLISRALATTFLSGRTVHIGITDSGREVAERLGEAAEFQQMNERSHLIVAAVGSFSATKLMRFVYEVVPELESMRWGEAIEL